MTKPSRVTTGISGCLREIWQGSGSVENGSAGCGVWKIRSVENAGCGKCRNMKLTNNLIPLYSH